MPGRENFERTGEGTSTSTAPSLALTSGPDYSMQTLSLMRNHRASNPLLSISDRVSVKDAPITRWKAGHGTEHNLGCSRSPVITHGSSVAGQWPPVTCCYGTIGTISAEGCALS